MLITATGANIRAICAEARRIAGLELANSREVLRSGGEDGCYRVHLADGTIIEATIVPRGRCSAELADPLSPMSRVERI